jgi:hypothetical protein
VISCVSVVNRRPTLLVRMMPTPAAFPRSVISFTCVARGLGYQRSNWAHPWHIAQALRFKELTDVLSERPIDGRTPNSKCLCDGRRADALLLERPHLQNIYAWSTPPVDAGCLCLRDGFQLTFFTKVGLEFSKHAQHVEESLPRGSACIYRLLSSARSGCAAAMSSDASCLTPSDIESNVNTVRAGLAGISRRSKHFLNELGSLTVTKKLHLECILRSLEF